MRSGSKGRPGGQAVVELALVASLLLLVSLGAVQFGIFYQVNIKVLHAAREGARYAASHATEATADADIKAHTVAAAPDLQPAITAGNVTVSPAAASRETGGDITVTVAYPVSPTVPFASAFLRPMTITRSVQMRVLP